MAFIECYTSAECFGELIARLLIGAVVSLMEPFTIYRPAVPAVTTAPSAAADTEATATAVGAEAASKEPATAKPQVSSRDGATDICKTPRKYARYV